MQSWPWKFPGLTLTRRYKLWNKDACFTKTPTLGIRNGTQSLLLQLPLSSPIWHPQSWSDIPRIVHPQAWILLVTGDSPPPVTAQWVFAQLQPLQSTDRKFSLTWKCQLFYQLSAWVWQRTKWELDTCGGFGMRQLLGLMPDTKQRRRGNAFAKGSPPHGLWLGSKLFDKEPQRWHGQNTSTECMCGSKGGKIFGLHENLFMIMNRSFQIRVCFSFHFLLLNSLIF